MNKIESSLSREYLLNRSLKCGDIVFDGPRALKTIHYNFLTGNAVFSCKEEKLIYKFFGPMSSAEKRRLQKRIQVLSKMDMFDIVKPKDMIVGSQKFLFSQDVIGITLKELEDFISLQELSQIYGRGTEYFTALTKASMALERIHSTPQRIILSDASFNNVLMQRNISGRYTLPRFIDLDSASIKGRPTMWLSRDMRLYYDAIGKKFKSSANNDRLNYLFLFLFSLFGAYQETIFDIDNYDFDKKAEKIQSLKAIRKLFNDLKKGKVPYIPYLHEFLIAEEGAYKYEQEKDSYRKSL